MQLRTWVAGFVLSTVGFAIQGQVINEFVANHTGTDNFSYVEVAGTPSTDYSDLTVLEIQGDATDIDDERGAIGNVFPVGATDANGIWVSAYGTANGPGDLDNGSITLLLVSGFSGTLGDDLDTDNDGTLDVLPWTAIVDEIAVMDDPAGEPNDTTYGTPVLIPNFDGISFFEPGGASRIPNGVDTNGISDWKRNDFAGEGLPGFGGGTVTQGEVPNTPGQPNEDGPLGLDPVIDEFIIDHTGSDTEERVEIWGQISNDYSAAVSLLVIDGDTGGTPGRVDAVFTVGTTNGVGMWSTGALPADTLANQSLTLLLVLNWTGSQGDDLDTDDDGTLDVMPWESVFDDVAIDDGSGADLFYSGVVLTPGFDGLSGAVGGASRVPSGVDTNMTADWVRNDFDGAGLTFGSDATLDQDEAWNTFEAVNRVRLEDYWTDVDTSSMAAMRMTIHHQIDDHQRLNYSSSDADTWDMLELADEDPLDSDRVVTIYRNDSIAKFGGGTGPYNREHTWPQSYGFPEFSLENSPRTDAHHLFLADPSYNTGRSNTPYGTCSGSCTEYATLAHNGVGGVGGPYPGDSNWSDGSSYEVWHHRRGDVARALLYLDLRYEGGAHGATDFAEPDLVLTDDTSLIVTSGGVNTVGTAYMGRLAVLLQWHEEDPVDADERRRNEVFWQFQGNRNPFIDNPEWVACAFSGDCGALFADGFESGDTGAWAP